MDRSAFDGEAFDYEQYENLSYEEYEKLCQERKQENARYLAQFEESLVKAGLTDATVNRHLDNVEFFLNTYLLREAPFPMQAGCRKAGDFLGDFFIRKCMWSTPASIKSTAASFKKLYKCMLEHKQITDADYAYLVDMIRGDMEFWQEDCRAFNDPDASNPFSPF